MCSSDLIGDFYYILNGIEMVAFNVAELSLVPDFITSNGGISNIVILDGVTVRVHTGTDGFGEYTEDDDYMNPAEALQIESGGMLMSDYDTGEDGTTVVQSTLDLDQQSTTTLEAASYSGGISGEYVDVPKTVPLPTRIVNDALTDEIIGRTRYNMKLADGSWRTWAMSGMSWRPLKWKRFPACWLRSMWRIRAMLPKRRTVMW